MLFWVYWLIAAIILVLSARELFSSNDWRKQLSAAVVLIPLALRVFLLK